MSTTRPPAYDERTTSTTEASRRGAHRARVKPVVAGLPVVAGVLIMLAVAGGGYAVFGPGNSSSPSASVEAASPGNDTTATVPASAGASAAATTPAQATTPAAPATTRPSTPAATTGSEGGTVDRSVSLVVLNSVPVQGLAKRVAANLQPDGWTVSRTDNSIQKNLATTKVYYGTKATKATAQALAKDLGFGTVIADPSVAKNGGIVVVLGQDAV